MANFVMTKFKVNVAQAVFNLASDSLKFMLLTSSYVPNQDTDGVYSDISANEVSGAGYTTTGQALGGVTVNTDNVNHRMKLTASNPSWPASTITARYGVIYDVTAGNKLICLYDFGQNYSSTNGTFAVTFDGTNGALTLSLECL